MKRHPASFTQARELARVRSTSFARRRQRPIHANVRSTTQRRDKTVNPLPPYARPQGRLDRHRWMRQAEARSFRVEGEGNRVRNATLVPILALMEGCRTAGGDAVRTRSADLLRVSEVAVRGMPEAIVQQQPAKQEASARLECGTPAEALPASPSDTFHWSSGTTASGDQLFVQSPNSAGPKKRRRSAVPQRLPMHECPGKHTNWPGHFSWGSAPSASLDRPFLHAAPGTPPHRLAADTGYRRPFRLWCQHWHQYGISVFCKLRPLVASRDLSDTSNAP